MLVPLGVADEAAVSVQIEQARGAIADFFNSATPRIFGTELDSVDMVDLLSQPEAKQLLRDAQTHADIGDCAQAMAGLSPAFEALPRVSQMVALQLRREAVAFR
ncbi:hypothetical protein ACFV7Q_33310 [Streptomyces sp. NPDC059851]|uniref:hypothetical protein n=1 Tax=Streptomyces sp. NPDC059851 TaxID=3346971 RepID=UPI0036598B0D